MSSASPALSLDPNASLSWQRPTRLRRFGAWYVNAWIASTIVHVVAYFFDIGRFHWPIAIGLWLVLEVILYQPLKFSFGRYAMAIVSAPDGSDRVDPAITGRMHWLIMLLAVLEVLESNKLFARGLTVYDFHYFFGTEIAWPASGLLFALLAAATLLSAMGLFRLKEYGAFLIVGIGAFNFLNDYVSWPIAVKFADVLKAERESLRGRPLPITPEQIVLIRVWGGMATTAAIALALWALRGRFRPPRASFQR